ncbi:unnamed protein product, partial [Brenthis ino]
MDCKRNTFEGAHNVIPEFDPDANSQTAIDWIRKVNETANIYDWNEKQIIYYAIPKLCGYARKWYQGRSTLNLSWRQWQRKILKTFPDDRNYADRLYEMLERKSKRDESLEEYYHDKARLVKMCGVRGRNAVDCIINGIFDNNIRLNAQGSSFKRPSQLLKYLRRISKKTIGLSRKMIPESKNNTFSNKDYSSTQRTINMNATTSYGSRNRFRTVRCYNCTDVGHTAQNCTKPIKRCDKCRRLGHEAQDCQRIVNSGPHQIGDKNSSESNGDTKRVLQITNEDQRNGKYYKSIKLNGAIKTAYIDFGSQCTLIKEEVASESNLVLNKINLPVIKGFAFGSVLPLGKVMIDIEVDAVKANVDAYVVTDDLLKTDVLIGQSLTELPSVTVYKTSSDLILYCDKSNLDRINIYNSLDIGFKGFQSVKVHTDGEYTGLLFIPGNVCTKLGEEYCTLQGVYQFEKGLGNILMINFSNNMFTIYKSKVIARAIKLPNSELVHMRDVNNEMQVNTINNSTINYSDKYSIPKDQITMEMLNVGPKISIQQKQQLLELLNNLLFFVLGNCLGGVVASMYGGTPGGPGFESRVGPSLVIESFCIVSLSNSPEFVGGVSPP